MVLYKTSKKLLGSCSKDNICFPYNKGYPLRDHGNQNCTSLMSFVVDSWEVRTTQRGALVVRIVYGCPYYKSPEIFHLFYKLPQVKNCLFHKKRLCNVHLVNLLYFRLWRVAQQQQVLWNGKKTKKTDLS